MVLHIKALPKTLSSVDGCQIVVVGGTPTRGILFSHDADITPAFVLFLLVLGSVKSGMEMKLVMGSTV